MEKRRNGETFFDTSPFLHFSTLKKTMTKNLTLLNQLKLIDLIEKDLGKPRQKSGRWMLWFCPFHPDKKTPSLGANQENESWHCFGCNKGGDAITWLREYRKLSYSDALAYLGDNQKKPVHFQQEFNVDVQRKEDTEPSEVWQKRGNAFLEYAVSQLWQNPDALAYLREKRLLGDNAIRYFCLGFNPTDLWDSPERWGLSASGVKRVWLPKEFVIPCFAEKSLWYIKIRQIDKEPKYIHVRGSAPALFGTDSLCGAPLILLTEGEFDCMLTWQLLRDIAGVATLGSANKKLDLACWLRHLLPAEEIIAVLDNDHAGKLGAQNLAGLSAQIHPVRIPSLSPAGKDITDYVQAGGDLWEWLKHHLVRIETLSSF